MGPIILGVGGAAIAFVALALNVVLLKPDSDRYRLDLENAYDGGSNVRQLVIDQGRLTLLAAFGAGLQLVALIWEIS